MKTQENSRFPVARSKARRPGRTVSLTLAPLLALVLGWHCTGNPLPANKKEYAGLWRGPGIKLRITPDGRIKYNKARGAGHTKINAPIKEWKGNDFVVGFGPMNTTFKVSRPPYQDNGLWKMVVDGITLTRTR